MRAFADKRSFSTAPETRVLDYGFADGYPAHAGPDEVFDVLTQLIEIARAAVWVALESAHAAAGGPVAEALRAIQHDEARWCEVLQRHIAALGRPPAPTMGAFYETAMAIDDLGRRLAFLNRGQSWVVKTLRSLLPRVRDGGLQADLGAMLRTHEANILLVGAALCGDRG